MMAKSKESSFNAALHQFGSGDSRHTVAAALGITSAEFEQQLRQSLTSRLPDLDRQRMAPVGNPVQIHRDALGIPHIYANNDHDLFFGLGFAMAQDRLWQLD